VKRKRFLALLAAALVCVPAFGAALSMDALEVHVGMLTMGNYTAADNGLSPPIGLIGASTVFALDALPAPWVLGLGLDLFGTWYEWDAANGRALLSERDTWASFVTVGIVASPRIGLRFSLSDAVAMGAFFGLDLLLRFPFAPFSKYTTFLDDRLPALGYFMTGRFLYPGLGWWMTWQATKGVQLALSLRGLAPLYRAWSPEVTAFLHQFVFAGTLGMTIKLARAAVAAEPATEPATEPAAP
jgi:hypothetical protein